MASTLDRWRSCAGGTVAVSEAEASEAGSKACRTLQNSVGEAKIPAPPCESSMSG